MGSWFLHVCSVFDCAVFIHCAVGLLQKYARLQSIAVLLIQTEMFVTSNKNDINIINKIVEKQWSN